MKDFKVEMVGPWVSMGYKETNKISLESYIL